MEFWRVCCKVLPLYWHLCVAHLRHTGPLSPFSLNSLCGSLSLSLSRRSLLFINGTFDLNRYRVSRNISKTSHTPETNSTNGVKMVPDILTIFSYEKKWVKEEVKQIFGKVAGEGGDRKQMKINCVRHDANKEKQIIWTLKSSYTTIKQTSFWHSDKKGNELCYAPNEVDGTIGSVELFLVRH